MHKLSLLLLLYYSQMVLGHELISKLKSPVDINANGQSTRENQWEFMRPGESWIVAEEISCWEQNGQWEELLKCPESTIVTAHRFRYLVRTGLTGIQLKCTKTDGRDETETEHILQMHFDHKVENDLPRGKWGIWKNGSASVFAEGFSFNWGELSLGRSVKNYNVIYPSGNERQSAVDSDFVLRKCPPDHAICGITAMMDKAGLGILTAIGLKCCFHCVPTETWVTVHNLSNSKSVDYQGKVNAVVGLGFQRSLQNDQLGSANHLRKDIALLSKLQNIFSANLGRSSSTGFDWFNTPFSIWRNEAVVSKAYTCQSHNSCVFKQVVGQCGTARVPVDKFCQVSTPVERPTPGSCQTILDNFPFTNCSDQSKTLRPPASKVEVIDPHGNGTSLEVLCDFEVDGGGWTIIQKRTSGPKEQFKQNWNKYKNGFGTLDGNFWIGLENIHALTKNGNHELRIELEDFEGEKKWAKYSRFSISDASDFYKLTLGGFSRDSTLQDSMTYHNGQKFSTTDKDNDNLDGENCAAFLGEGGWWFRNCGSSYLNGLYFEKGETVPWLQGINWSSWKGYEYSLAKSEMKIRKRKP